MISLFGANMMRIMEVVLWDIVAVNKVFPLQFNLGNILISDLLANIMSPTYTYKPTDSKYVFV